MENRNILLAIIISVGILMSWQILIEGPRIEEQRVAQEAAQKRQAAAQATRQQTGEAVPPPPGQAPVAGGVPGSVPSVGVPGGGVPVAGQPAGQAVPTRSTLIGSVARVSILSDVLNGSLTKKGARIDDLVLTQYRETTDKTSPNITLLSPKGGPKAYYAQFGWVPHAPGIKVPGSETLWTTDRETLSPSSPVTMTWDNGEGLVFKLKVALDENYMFTVTQRVTNKGGQTLTLSPYGLISRTETPDTLGFYILHEGLVGVFDDILEEIDYDDLQEEPKGTINTAAQGGWIGITDKFWLAALIPDQKAKVDYRFIHSLVDRKDKYQVDFRDSALTVAPGQTVESTNRLFAGAKVVSLLDAYEKQFTIPKFWKAVDFGWFHWLTKPIFHAMEYFNNKLGNFGLAILLLTVCIKILFFPLANKSYKAMSRLKSLQPMMLDIRERFKEDRVKQNQAMMELYKKEKANPMAGCLPIVIQIPVFFALYKVLFVTIEMRHAPFYGWIQDLSAPDPLGVLMGFGLFDWQVPQILAVVNIGVWPIIMGITMFLQQKLNPAPADPVQAKIFMFLPIVFTFLLGQFAAGLVIYWAWNNLLSITQQWVIMRRMGVTISGQKTAAAAAAAAAPKMKSTANDSSKTKGEKRSQHADSKPRKKKKRK